MNIALLIVPEACDSGVLVDAHGSRVSRPSRIERGDAAIRVSQEPVNETAAVRVKPRD